jgi:dihydropyrimidinase
MFVTLVHIHVKPDHVETFLDATRANHEASIREDGNLRFDVLRSVEDPNRFVLYEWYVDEAAGVPVYIVHLSAKDALDAVRGARDRGMQAFAETCPQYLFLSLDDLGNGFEGAKFVCSPPLRDKDPHWEELWRGLVKDDLQVVSTDHCPFDFEGQKELGRGDFRKIPNGLPGVEDRVDLLHDGGVAKGRISRERWVDIISTGPAKLFGMYPHKGAIAVGSDADIVV